VGLAQIPAAPSQDPPAKDISLNVQYEAGTRLQQQIVGVSFIVPKDWAGRVTENDPGFVLFPKDGRALTAGLVLALATAPKPLTPTDISQLMYQNVSVAGVTFKPDAPPTVSGDQISASYTADTFLGKIYGKGIALLSDKNNAILFSAFGPEKEKDNLPNVLNELIASARFTAPQFDSWAKLITGSKFRLESGTYNPGDGSSGDSTSTTNNTFLEFCPSMAYHYSSVGFVNVGGSIAEFNEQKNGRWGLALDILGASAVLVPDDGSAWVNYRLGASGDTVTFNGNASVRFATDGCGGG
jgi:hypothetical protein